MTAAAWPDHLLTLDEWDAIPEDRSHRYELVEGVLLVVPRPAPMHQRVAARLAVYLDACLPDEFSAFGDVEVMINPVYPATVRAPDVLVVPTVRADENPPRFDAGDVLVAVEIVSPGTGRTDRVTKLAEYADAGIPHYWIIELDEPVTLTAFSLVDGEYGHLAGGTGKIEIVSPFPVVLDLAELTRR